MILQCSACQARYLVPDQAIGADGRTVQCAKCRHKWFQSPPPESAKGLDDLTQVLDEINARPKPIPPGSNLPAFRRRPIPLNLKLAVSFAGAVAAVLLILVIYPALLGLPPSRGMVLADVGITRLSIDNKLVYEINGKILNTTKDAMRVPDLRITLIGDNNIKLQSWDFGSKGKMLAPGKNIPFTTGNLEVPPNKAARFTVDLGNPLELALRRDR